MPGAAVAADWTGAASNDWFTTGNWNPGAVPTAGSAVAIDTITPNPTVVDGANAVATSIIVGDNSTGMLTILNGGTVNSDLGYMGYNQGSFGTVKVNGPGTIWTNSARIYVGNAGTGTLMISNGGTVNNVLGVMGNFSGSDGTAIVDGAGSTWTNSANLVVGQRGAAALTISNGGIVSNVVGSVDSMQVPSAP